MKNFSLLSLLAIAALSASLSHAAAEFELFQERIFRQGNSFFGYKEVGRDNWVYCKAIDKNGDLADPQNWDRINDNFYSKTENDTDVTFTIRVEGPSVAAKANKFGVQVKRKKVKAPTHPIATAVEAHDQAGDAGEADKESGEKDPEEEAKQARQVALLYPPNSPEDDGGEEADARPARPNVFRRAWGHVANSAHYLAAAAHQATADANGLVHIPKGKQLYMIGTNQKMQWNQQAQCYELFELVEDFDDQESNLWKKADENRYKIVNIMRDGFAQFSAIKDEAEDKDDAEHKEDGQDPADLAGVAPTLSPRAISVASAADVADALSSSQAAGEGVDNAFDRAYKPSKRSAISNVWGRVVGAGNYVARAAHQATVDVDQRPVARRKAQAAPTATQDPAQDGQPAQGWGAMFRGMAAYVRDAALDATVDQPANDGGSSTDEETN